MHNMHNNNSQGMSITIRYIASLSASQFMRSV
jgi:hypothetical protein